jgi:hypothetical protein
MLQYGKRFVMYIKSNHAVRHHQEDIPVFLLASIILLFICAMIFAFHILLEMSNAGFHKIRSYDVVSAITIIASAICISELKRKAQKGYVSDCAQIIIYFCILCGCALLYAAAEYL